MNEQISPPKLFAARHYLGVGQPMKALRLLNEADSETVDLPYFWLLRGQAYFDLEQYFNALQAVEKGLAIEPEHIPLLYLLCDCQAKRDNLAAAEKAILAALKQAPDDPQLLCRYALLVSRAGQLEKAEKLIAKAAALDPEHPAVDRSRVILAYLKGDDRQTAELSKDMLQKEPEDILGHYLLGSAHAGRGQVVAADRSFGKAVRLNPGQKELARSARATRTYAHWLLLPLRPLYRFGTVPVWLFAIVTILVLRALGLEQAVIVFSIIYFVFVVYSWVVPPLLKRWLQRNYHSFK